MSSPEFTLQIMGVAPFTLNRLCRLWTIVLAFSCVVLISLVFLPDSILRSNPRLFAASSSDTMNEATTKVSTTKKDGKYIPRVLFVLSTYEKVYETRIKKIYETWGKRVEENPEYMEFLFIGIEGEKAIPKMRQARCPLGYWEGMYFVISLNAIVEYGNTH